MESISIKLHSTPFEVFKLPNKHVEKMLHSWLSALFPKTEIARLLLPVHFKFNCREHFVVINELLAPESIKTRTDCLKFSDLFSKHIITVLNLVAFVVLLIFMQTLLFSLKFVSTTSSEKLQLYLLEPSLKLGEMRHFSIFSLSNFSSKFLSKLFM